MEGVAELIEAKTYLLKEINHTCNSIPFVIVTIHCKIS